MTMIEKLQRNLRMIAFAWRIGAALRDKLVLMRLLTRHILVNRGWAHFTGEVTTIQGIFRGQVFTVHLRDNGTDIIIVEDVFHRQCYDLGDRAVHHIVDAGANIGLASLYFSLRYPGAAVASFEPVEHAMCARQVGKVSKLALGKEEGLIHILIDPKNSGGHRLELYDADPNLQRVQVPLKRLDTLIDEGCIAAPDVLKIDAEGAECDILEGLGSYVDDLQCLVAELQSAKNQQWMKDHLVAHGFTKIEERILHPEASLPGEAYSMMIARR